ncbi:MAG: tRNA (adenosine(37)-N6)-threonylcarbamoyltransferase complex ATPase subunit type 1 TsaE [Tepidisphaerales bacterium]
MHVYRSRSEAETDALAKRLIRAVPRGSVLALHGPMGAGKTRLVRGIVAALGGQAAAVSSPTFVLLHVYATPAGKVYHLDAYRTRSAADLEGIGFEEVLAEAAEGVSGGGVGAASGGWVCVEWPERVAELLPPPPRLVRVEIRPVCDETSGEYGEGSGDDGAPALARELVLPVPLPD